MYDYLNGKICFVKRKIITGLNQPAGVHTLTEKAKMAFYFKYDWQEHAACLKD